MLGEDSIPKEKRIIFPSHHHISGTVAGVQASHLLCTNQHFADLKGQIRKFPSKINPGIAASRSFQKASPEDLEYITGKNSNITWSVLLMVQKSQTTTWDGGKTL